MWKLVIALCQLNSAGTCDAWNVREVKLDMYLAKSERNCIMQAMPEMAQWVSSNGNFNDRIIKFYCTSETTKAASQR